MKKGSVDSEILLGWLLAFLRAGLVGARRWVPVGSSRTSGFTNCHALLRRLPALARLRLRCHERLPHAVRRPQAALRGCDVRSPGASFAPVRCRHRAHGISAAQLPEGALASRRRLRSGRHHEATWRRLLVSGGAAAVVLRHGWQPPELPERGGGSAGAHRGLRAGQAHAEVGRAPLRACRRGLGWAPHADGPPEATSPACHQLGPGRDEAAVLLLTAPCVAVRGGWRLLASREALCQ